MIIPALPAIQHDLGASQEGVTWLLTIFLLTSSVSHPAARPLRRHVRQGEGAAGRARRLRLGLLRVRDRWLDRGVDPRPGDPGRRGGDLPARLRDHPRRVPAGARGDLDRTDLGDFRHRWRAGTRACRRDRRPSFDRVDLLVLAGGHGRRRMGDVALRSRVAGPREGEDRLARSRAAVACAGLTPARRLAGQRLGLGLDPACWGCSPPPPSSAAPSSRGSAGSRADGGHAAHVAGDRCGRPI